MDGLMAVLGLVGFLFLMMAGASVLDDGLTGGAVVGAALGGLLVWLTKRYLFD